MKTRIIFGAVMIAAITALLIWDFHLERSGYRPVALPLACLTGLLIILGVFEMARLLRAKTLPPLIFGALVGSLALALLPLWQQWLSSSAHIGSSRIVLIVLGLIVALLCFLQMALHRIDNALLRLSGTMWTVAYLGGLGAAVLALRIEFGMGAWVLFLAAVKLTDIGAYFTGSFLGRHKLIPWLSPGKTWEGLFGGLLLSAVAAVLLNWIFKTFSGDGFIIGLWQAAAFGAIMGLVGQFGDLCESLMKRDAGIKDSGALVPGFGGVLDIVDSPLIAAPAAWLLLLAWT